MANDRMDELFACLEQSSSTYASRATQLSDAIQEFEGRLHSTMKGKFSALVTREESSTHLTLGYLRLDNTWRLCFGMGKRDHGVRPLQDCPVEQKIHAVALFEELLNEIFGKQEAQSGALHRALDGISPFLDGEKDQEGGE